MRLQYENRELCEDINCEDCPFMKDTCKLFEVFKEFYEQGKYDATITKPSKSTEQNVADVPSGDLISREEAIDTLRGLFDMRKSRAKVIVECFGELLNALPSADRPKGEWIDREDSNDMFFLYRYECSVCGGKNVFNSSYCPNCGAHMR